MHERGWRWDGRALTAAAQAPASESGPGPGGRKLRREVSGQWQGRCRVLRQGTRAESQEAWPCLQPAPWPSLSHLTSLNLCFFY